MSDHTSKRPGDSSNELLSSKSDFTLAARLSNPWTSDDADFSCTECREPFTIVNRRHHCRLCGHIYCQDCSTNRALIPPSDICISGGGLGKHHLPQNKESTFRGRKENMENPIGFEDDGVIARDGSRSLKPSPGSSLMISGIVIEVASSDSEEDNKVTEESIEVPVDKVEDPNFCRLSIVSKDSIILYSSYLEERFKLAREPLRVCNCCYAKLLPMQEVLRDANSNAVRCNSVNPASIQRFFNSPLAFTLGHEIRKAARTLNNLLPIPESIDFINDLEDDYDVRYQRYSSVTKKCKEACSTISPNLVNLDGVRIPARLINMARGIAVITVVKGGFGVAGAEFGTGLVIARLDDDGEQSSRKEWSSPSAVSLGGLSWGALVGAQVSNHVFLLMTDAAVDLLFSSNGSLHLGADAAVSVGPVGRTVEGDVGISSVTMAPIYTYSLSMGMYMGVSFDGKVMFTRHGVNEKFYGYKVNPRDLLNGAILPPPAAKPLYDSLRRCHVYAK